MTQAASPGAPMGSPVARFDNLTVARFFAALLVFMHHTVPPGPPNTPPGFLRTALTNGYTGVTFFFVLSGFVLAHADLDKIRPSSAGDWFSFYWKRIARIVPLWLLVSAPFIWMHRHDPGLWRYLTFTQAWDTDLDDSIGIYSVSWTLSVEMFFYAMFPLIALAVRSFARVLTGPVLILLGLGFSGLAALYFVGHPELVKLSGEDPASAHHWLYRFPGLRLGDFLMGIGACLVVRRRPPPWANRWLGVVLVLAMAALFLRMGKVPIGTTPFWTFPDVAFFTVIVLCLAWLEIGGVSVKSRKMILLGEASFAFYLIHQNYMAAFLLPDLVPVAGVYSARVITLVMTVSASIGLFLLVETPARRLLMRLPQLFRGIRMPGSARRMSAEVVTVPVRKDA